jgi:hypothetical protein
MSKLFSGLLILAIGLVACGKKPEASQPAEKAPARKVSVDSAPAEAPPPPPAPVAAPPPTDNATAVAVNVDTSQVNPKREDQMEKWLSDYQTGDAAQKARVVKEVKTANLNAAEKALMENTRSRYGYQKIPIE